MSTEDKQVCEAVVERKGIGQEDREYSGISDYGVSLDSPLAHSTSYPKTLEQTMRNKSVSEDADKWSMLVDLIKENSASLKGLQESYESLRKSLQESLRKTIKEVFQEDSERREMLQESLKKGSQDSKTSYTKMECNLKKEMQELSKQLKMNIDKRERKLQENIEQIQGDVEKIEGKLTKKMEDDIEETKAELGEIITEVDTNCDHGIAEVTQMQKQCNDVVKGIGDRQNQLAVNLRNAIAMRREEDNQRVAMEGEAFTWGIKKKEGTKVHAKSKKVNSEINKFNHVYKGPYRIIKIGHPNTVELEYARTKRVHGKEHVENINRYYSHENRDNPDEEEVRIEES
ncbi:paramyosin-like [Schistocerca americana]|uniref:paramyosin-like n=1 Tax=Schistocerca americana TaxID=7009 RepID=UPI001F50392F|nr:paramyosin-like [Schistocerca americana]